MKPIYKTIIFCLALVTGLVSCDDKHDELPATGGLDHAEQLAVGTYVGTWTRTNLSTQVVETGDGSLVFEVDESLGNNVSMVTLTSDKVDLGVTNKTCGANISRLSSGILTYWNVYTLNTFGTAFTGKINLDGEATMQYNKVVRTGRREAEYTYVFVGHKTSTEPTE